MLRITVTELHARDLDRAWPALVDHTRRHASDVVLLPEMPFSPWLAASRRVDPDAWAAAVESHDAWLDRLGELHATIVAGSRPVITAGRRLNEAYLWTPEHGYRAAHVKAFLPDEPGFWEATWYERGPVDFRPAAAPPATVGFQLCTELWFFEHARAYGAAGVDLLLCPRATPSETLDKWIAGGRVAGVCSGAFSLSANHAGTYGDVAMAGGGWIISPEGEVLGITTPQDPFVTVAVDLDEARRAKSTYPRYVDASEA